MEIIKYDRSRHFDIPKYFYFEAMNSTVGGKNTFNYRIDPRTDKEKDPPENKLRVQIWYGLMCSDLAEMLFESEFEHTFEGYKDMIYWLDDQYDDYAVKVKSGEVEGRRTFREDLD